MSKLVRGSGIFFSYFGGKYMRSPHYPRPQYDIIVEPFAGAAGYSTRYALGRKALLIDASPYVAGVWRYLISASPEEIMRLPLMEPGQHVDQLTLCQEIRWLIGFWINQGSAVPKKTMGGRASNRRMGTWGEGAKERLARQVDLIREWEVIEGDFRAAPDHEATWFVDPPYEKHPSHYAADLGVSYNELGEWCRSRRGQVMVCETECAGWLPFQPITTVAGASHRITTELLWQSITPAGRSALNDEWII